MKKFRKWFKRNTKKTVPSQPEKKTTSSAHDRSFSQKRNWKSKRKPHDRRKAGSQATQAVGPKTQILKDKLKVMFFGGLNEVGKNMVAFEYEDDILVVDMGFAFPEEDMLGIDYVLPDVSYLEKNRERIRGVVITHGHLDHIGGIPYILPKLNYPTVYGTKLTLGLIDKKIEEFKLKNFTNLVKINPDETLKLGVFTVDFFRVVHSIPGAVGLAITTPVGKLVYTGDFKFDDSPAGYQEKADLHKIRKFGEENILALFSDSTNALKPGKTMSESEVGKALEDIIKKTEGRLIIASFSSLLGRIQQIVDYAEKHGRTIFLSGKSLIDNFEIAHKLGVIRYKNGSVLDIKKYKNFPDQKTLILTTGSQGETVSALSRIARNDHKYIKMKKGDKVVLSSSPIIGNERAIATVINRLCLLGAVVIHKQLMDVHTSGHGQQEDLLRMIRLVRPKYFIPIHGEYFMRQGHAILAKEQGNIPEERIFMLQNGDVLIAEKGRTMRVSKATVEAKYILIDGSGEGREGSRVQTERTMMSQNGALVILIYASHQNRKLNGHPDVISRGFIYMHETEKITGEIAEIAEKSYKNIISKNPDAPSHDIKKYIEQSINRYTEKTLERRPLIIPLIIDR